MANDKPKLVNINDLVIDLDSERIESPILNGRGDCYGSRLEGYKITIRLKCGDHTISSSSTEIRY